MKTLYEFLDCHYGDDGDAVLRTRLDAGEDLELIAGPHHETPLLIAARRARATAVKSLLEAGANPNAQNVHGKTAYAHAIRRGFTDVVEVLEQAGADTSLNAADTFAMAVTRGRLDEARRLLDHHPGIARTGNPEEDRLLADIAGRSASEPVAFLLAAGANVNAPGLDEATPLHQAAWFGQPENAQLLIDAGAALNYFDPVHGGSPLGWVTHGSRYSGDAENRQEQYVAVTRLLLEAGATLQYPGDLNSERYFKRLMRDASDPVREVLAPYAQGV